MKKFPITNLSSDEVLREIDRLCARDYRFEEGRILNSICSQPLPVAIEAFLKTIHTNLGDNRIFPGVRNIEEQVTQMLGNLLGAREACGNIVSGGTEANLLALLAAKERAKRKKKVFHPEVIVPFSIHFSVEKVAKILDLKLRFAKLTSEYRADAEDVEKNINENTIAIMATAGTSELGSVDDTETIAKIARKHDLYFHVDAASGGFIIPFAKELGYPFPGFDFSVEGVDSITVDPHKFGLAVIPSGYILFKSQEVRPWVCFESHYVGTKTHTTFTGTRPGAAAASVYAVIQNLGRSGFREIVKDYFEKRDFLIRELQKKGFELLCSPDLAILAVKCENALQVLEDLESKGWIVSLSKRYNAIRIVIHHHLTREHLLDFVQVFSSIAERIAA